MSQPLVVVFGSSRTQEPHHLAAAERLGRLLTAAGYTVGNGGYDAIMGAVSKGAYQAGGHVIGYTTDEFPDAHPNHWLHESHHTPDLHLRLRLMLEEGDAFIATWGGIGTLTEVILAWNVAQTAPYTGRPVKPLLLVGEQWPPLVQSLGRHSEIGRNVLAYPTLVETVDEAVVRLNGLLRLPVPSVARSETGHS